MLESSRDKAWMSAYAELQPSSSTKFTCLLCTQQMCHPQERISASQTCRVASRA